MKFCKNCKHYYFKEHGAVTAEASYIEKECRHPKNMKTFPKIFDWEGITIKKPRPRKTPQRINKHNNCPWFEKREYKDENM